MKLRLFTLVLLAGASLPTIVLAQTAAPADAQRSRDTRSQTGLTASPTDFGRVDIREGGEGTTPGGVTGKDLGGGYMIEEEAVKTRSTVTRDAIDKLSPTANPYKMIEMLPGVNVSSVDAFGLVGGNLTIRGFNSDQIGLTIEGAPVNDSGNYALYPQEYVDAENIGQVSTAQGSPDLDSPHIGATGGVINIYMREPSKKAGGLLGFSVGSNATTREFLRVETGQVGDLRAFASFSHYQGDHWNDPGHNRRDHFDFKTVWEPGQGNRIALSVIYNQATNNSYNTPTLSQYNSGNWGWVKTLPASFFSGPDQSANSAFNYYGFKVNPFKNAIVSLPSSFQVTKDLTVDTIPYFWYGFGNGGGTSTMSEQPLGSTANGVYYGSKSVAGSNLTGIDWTNNGIVSNTNKALYYNPSITLTHRPGIINKLTYTIGDHKIVAGYWFELAKHRQTAPYAALNADGSIADPYLTSGQFVIPNGPFAGSVLERRDTLTTTMTNMLFLGDTWSLWGDRLTLEYGIKQAWINRTVDNFVPGATPTNKYDDSATLPQLGFKYKLNEQNQVFGSIGTSFRSTPNFTLTQGYSNSSGALTTPIAPLPSEKSVTFELGHRYQGENFATAASLFYTRFKNHQINSNVLDPTGSTVITGVAINAGAAEQMGLDVEIGTRRFFGGWRAYASGELLRTRILDNQAVALSSTVTDFLPTSGKDLPRAPRYQTGLGLDYDDGHIFGNVTYKYTGAQYATLMNDEKMPGYGRLDAGIGYRFSDIGWAKQPEFKINLINVLNSKTLVGISGIQSNAVAQTSVNGRTINASGSPSYYAGQGFAALASMKVGF